MGLPSPRRIFRTLHSNLPPFNFITLHYSYFILTCLLSACIFWGASTPSRSVSFTDSLFLTTSAMTLAGLNTVNLSTLNTFQQFMLFLLTMMGSAIVVSAVVVHVRKNAFERKFQNIVEKERRRLEAARSRSRTSISLVRRFSASMSRSDNRPALPGRIIPGTTDSPDEKERVGGQDGGLELEESESLKRTEGSQKADQFAALENKSAEDIPETKVEKTSQLPDNGGPAAPEPMDSAVPDLDALRDERNKRTLIYRSETGDAINVDPDESAIDESSPPEHITFGPNTYFRTYTDSMPSRHNHHRFISMQGVGAHSNASMRVRPTSQATSLREPLNEAPSGVRADEHLPFPLSGYVSRNSQFHHMSDAEREKLGGCEYRALRLLAWLVPAYFVLWQLLSCLALGAYVANNRPSTARQNGLNPWWVGAFNAVSAFNNSGMSLLDANMVAFQDSVYMLITMGLLILAGNTCYPIFLRLIVWTMLKLMPDNDRWTEDRKTLQFLLDHPRRCYTNLFPSQHTWWLLLAVITLNGVDWAAFEILNIGNNAITSLPSNMEVLDGLFQAFAVRSGGFYVVTISNLRISLQVLYVVMMYISVYPVVITMRNSNVYEERSLGIYADDPGYGALANSNTGRGRFFGKIQRQLTGQGLEQTKSYFVRQQVRAQLAHDLWWLVLAVFLIMIIEGSQFERNPAVYSVFNVLFEVVSGYGCVGISVGLPDQDYSFCGGWHKLSKLILCAVMIRGRHRGLPVVIDKAVLLPGEELHHAEEEDAQIRMERTISRGRAV